MSYLAAASCSIKGLPFKVQAQKIKNYGTDTIYIFPIEDDIVIASGSLIAFSLAIVNPGHELDLLGHPNINYSYSKTDYDICIHSDGDVNVDITSDGPYNDWKQDLHHPWNGSALPNGQFTNRWKKPISSTPSVAKSTLTGANVTFTLGGNPIAYSSLNAGDFTVDFNYKEESSNYKKECSCTSRSLMISGCTCGHLVKKRWGL